MSKIDKTYHNLLNDILNNGRKYEDPNRKGIYRIQVPHVSFVHDFKDGFPAISTKKLYWKGVVGELLWFLRGDTNIKYLVDNGINIWNKDAYNYECKKTIFANGKTQWLEEVKKNNYGDLGRVYGAQWRKWQSWLTTNDKGYMAGYSVWTDQISNLIKNLKEKPLATDHIVTAWNPAELDDMALPPCHKGFQLMVYELSLQERMKYGTFEFGSTVNDLHCDKQNLPKYGFDLVWEQRSVDTFLGLPFNIASYALLAQIIGKIVNMVPGKIIGDLRNVHLYENSLEGVKEQLSRDVNKYDKCELNLDNIRPMKMGMHNSVDNWLSAHDISDFELQNYKSYPAINVEMLSRDE